VSQQEDEIGVLLAMGATPSSLLTLALNRGIVLVSSGTRMCVVLLEERELRDRFGAEYDEYCGRVPRYIPGL
jgi:protein-S-isoprenylcysteine O-methyltransferase Ste14